MNTTAENAEAISNLTIIASDKLREALENLRWAVQRAEGDYQCNAEQLQHLLGALTLAAGALSVEKVAWEGFGRERRSVEARVL